jgi:hypothetical protein
VQVALSSWYSELRVLQYNEYPSYRSRGPNHQVHQ